MTNVGGLPEIVADGETGLVVEPGGLTNAIVELARDPERVRTMGAAARARALTRFSPIAAVEGVERVYREQHQ